MKRQRVILAAAGFLGVIGGLVLLSKGSGYHLRSVDDLRPTAEMPPSTFVDSLTPAEQIPRMRNPAEDVRFRAAFKAGRQRAIVQIDAMIVDARKKGGSDTHLDHLLALRNRYQREINTIAE